MIDTSKKIDLTGDRFGNLVVIRQVESNIGTKWLCVCDCGRETEVLSSNLRNGHTKSCGCSKIRKFEDNPKYTDISGMVFGKLTALYVDKSTTSRKIKWMCLCECGNKVSVMLCHLKSGHTRSCGCNRKSNNHLRKHGMSKTSIYNVYRAMLSRCYNQKQISYPNYGGRGITVCDEWKKGFEIFYDWAINNGYRDGLTIDRIDVNGNYCPDNCRWITQREQSFNRRSNTYVELDGELITIKEASDLSGINYGTLISRNVRGWNNDELFIKPIRHGYTRETTANNDNK